MDKVEATGNDYKKRSRTREEIKERQAAYAKWKKEQGFKQSIYVSKMM